MRGVALRQRFCESAGDLPILRCCWSLWRSALFWPLVLNVTLLASHAGGGGERVLWRAVEETLALFAANQRPVQCVIYTGDAASDADIVQLAQVRCSLWARGAGSRR